MAEVTRASLQRITEEQGKQYKRLLAFVIFLGISLVMITVTFLNPSFMKGQMRQSNNQAIVVKEVDLHFNQLATLVGANSEANANLLTSREALPIADYIVDYTLGVHLFRTNSTELAHHIYGAIKQNIDDDSASDAQDIRDGLKKQSDLVLANVTTAFNLSLAVLGANLVNVLLIINVVIVVITMIMLVSLIQDLRGRLGWRQLIHEVTGGVMWAGFWMILLFGFLAILPIFVTTQTLNLTGIGYLLELASCTFLDYVIVGVVLYIIAAIPWQATSPK